MAAPDFAALLALHRPVMQYDALESYYADSAGVIPDRPGNVLRRADGTVIATALTEGGGGSPVAGGGAGLTLAFLRPGAYPNGEPVEATDYVDETGSDYVAQAREMHARPGYDNRVHGRVVSQAGTTWLQYWLFMYYDDPGFLGFGTHEGDIEMIQIRLDAHGAPDAVSYAQHRSGVSAAWADVEREGQAPVVYSGRGTHASMLRSGTLVSGRTFIPDHNDGHGPRVRPDLVTLTETQTPWAWWPGHWGSTRPEHELLGKIGIEANSPFALCDHMAWSDPAGFHARCDPDDLPAPGEPHTFDAPAPPQPKIGVTVDPESNVARVSYAVPDVPGAAAPTSLVIAVGAPRGAMPPATTSVAVEAGSGSFETPLDPGATSVEVRATTHADSGAVSPTAVADS